MELLKSLNTPIAERARSPFYGSFVITWLIWNWKIILTVLFLRKKDFGDLNLVQFISTNYINVLDSLVWPLLISLGCIFLLPVVDYWIMWYSEYQKKRRVDKKIKIGRESFVQGDVYYDLKLRFEEERSSILKLTEELNKEIAASKAISMRKKELEEDNKDLKFKKDDFEEKYERVLNSDSIKQVFQGRWTLDYFHSETVKGSEEINMAGYSYRVINNTDEFPKYDINLFVFDKEHRKISFVKTDVNDKSLNLINNLTIISDDKFEGRENGTTKVTYTRRKFIGNPNTENINVRDTLEVKIIDSSKK